MRTDQRGIALVCGLVALGTMGYTAYQLFPAFGPNQAPASNGLSEAGKTHPKFIAEKPIPAVTTDPFRKIEAPVTLDTAPSVAAGVGTGTAQSNPVSLAGPISSDPSPELPQPASSSMSNAGSDAAVTASAPIGPKFVLRGVIITDLPRAYLDLDGKGAKPFLEGAVLSPGITLTTVNENFVEITMRGKVIRVRIGQEVNPS